MRFDFSDRQGFTLMEMIIGFIVSAVIVAASIPVATEYINGAKAASAVKEARTIADAEAVYYQYNFETGCSGNVHVYTSAFNNLTLNSNYLNASTSDTNYFGMPFVISPQCGSGTSGSEGSTGFYCGGCVQATSIIVYTYVPDKLKGVANGIAGAFGVGESNSHPGYFKIAYQAAAPAQIYEPY